MGDVAGATWHSATWHTCHVSDVVWLTVHRAADAVEMSCHTERTAVRSGRPGLSGEVNGGCRFQQSGGTGRRTSGGAMAADWAEVGAPPEELWRPGGAQAAVEWCGGGRSAVRPAQIFLFFLKAKMTVQSVRKGLQAKKFYLTEPCLQNRQVLYGSWL